MKEWKLIVATNHRERAQGHDGGGDPQPPVPGGMVG
jgi:hypothetical protein